jgi:hypothetical protein
MVKKLKKGIVKNKVLRKTVVFIFLILFLYSISVIVYEREAKNIFLEDIISRGPNITSSLPSLMFKDFFINLLVGLVSGIVSTLTLMTAILFGGASFIYIALDPTNLSLIDNNSFQLIFFPILIGGISGFMFLLFLKKQLKYSFLKKKG